MENLGEAVRYKFLLIRRLVDLEGLGVHRSVYDALTVISQDALPPDMLKSKPSTNTENGTHLNPYGRSKTRRKMCLKATCGTCRMFSVSHLSSSPETLNSGNFLKADSLLLCTEKATWWGCGNHVPSVMDSIPDDQRCQCEPQVEREGKRYPSMAPKKD